MIILAYHLRKQRAETLKPVQGDRKKFFERVEVKAI
jgi:hypothetical protein